MEAMPRYQTLPLALAFGNTSPVGLGAHPHLRRGRRHRASGDVGEQRERLTPPGAEID